ncbi:hypothetical protein EGJ86_19190 [Pseudomonas sp. o96-267]|nr:hypothetical protein EGJ86_19190 [Pseudomonas sp. o96-267]
MARLTPAEYKAGLKEKGWSGRSLAERWDFSPSWVSKLINDPERPLHWDDALRGLPQFSGGKRKS